MIGCAAPSVAATPPGRRCAATKSRGKKQAMLRAPRTRLFHHHVPRGSVREARRARTPAGSVRISAAKTGRPGGRAWVVTMYVVPHTAGARDVRAIQAILDRRSDRAPPDAADLESLEAWEGAAGVIMRPA